MSNVIYRVNGFIAHSERDNFERGCIGDAQTRFADEFRQEAPTLRGLLVLLAGEFGAEVGGDALTEYWGDFILDCCEEPGRVDIQVQQRKPFLAGRLSNDTLDRFKSGAIDLWLTEYSFHVERVESGFSLLGDGGANG